MLDRRKEGRYFLHGTRKIYFEEVYDLYLKKLCAYATKFTGSVAIAQDLVQEVFVAMLDKQEGKQIDDLNSYLIRAIRNHCLNWLRNRKVSSEYVAHFRRVAIRITENEADHSLAVDDVRKVVSELPSKYREVFELSRFENLPSDEIAERLSINKRTVENRLSDAMRLLRISLKS